MRASSMARSAALHYEFECELAEPRFACALCSTGAPDEHLLVCLKLLFGEAKQAKGGLLAKRWL